jgi:hypothetical protein
MGLFLLMFPWVDAWNWNYFSYIQAASYQEASLAEWWRRVWLSPYFRGAISGLGLLNLYISLHRVFRLRRPLPVAGAPGREISTRSGSIE